MATKNVSRPKTVAAPSPAIQQDDFRKVLHEPFRWDYEVLAGRCQAAPELQAVASFAAKVYDVTSGARDVLGILEEDIINECCGDEFGRPLPALLPTAVSGNLMRLVIASLGMLAAEAEKRGDWAAARARESGKVAS